jgi:hypothetical protein
MTFVQQRADGSGHRAVHAMRSIAVLTLLFGVVVATSWLPFGRRAFGGAPEAVLASAWPLVYGPLVLLTAGIGFGYAQRRRPTWRRAAGVVIGAWLGELVVLSLAGGLLANEIGPLNAWFYWLLATGGPLQPAAGLLGVLVALGTRRA